MLALGFAPQKPFDRTLLNSVVSNESAWSNKSEKIIGLSRETMSFLSLAEDLDGKAPWPIQRITKRSGEGCDHNTFKD